jgi:Bacterial CdiA-CT RNAse A domain
MCLRILVSTQRLFRTRAKLATGETFTMTSQSKMLLFFVLAFWICGCGQIATPVNQPSEQPRRAPAVSPSADRYDLERDERRGGHTLDRHVGRSDADLQERLERERNISAASTWTDRATAEEVVAEALRAERRRIDSWMNRGERRSNLALHYDARRTIGRSLRRGENQVVPCTSAVIVLRASGPDGFYVLTTYPEARE